MSNFNYFKKENKNPRNQIQYKATMALLDENKIPLDWTIKAVTTKEQLLIQQECLKTKDNEVYKIDNNKFMTKYICKAVIEPNLNNRELQDSYGVMNAEDLIVEMLDNYDEFERLFMFIKAHSQFNFVPKKEIDTAINTSI